MLVLSRKIGESIVIGDGIVVRLVRIAGNRVSLGIEAPDNVRVLRAELANTADPPPREAAESHTDRMRLVAR